MGNPGKNRGSFLKTVEVKKMEEPPSYPLQNVNDSGCFLIGT